MQFVAQGESETSYTIEFPFLCKLSELPCKVIKCNLSFNGEKSKPKQFSVSIRDKLFTFPFYFPMRQVKKKLLACNSSLSLTLFANKFKVPYASRSEGRLKLKLKDFSIFIRIFFLFELKKNEWMKSSNVDVSLYLLSDKLFFCLIKRTAPKNMIKSETCLAERRQSFMEIYESFRLISSTRIESSGVD